jgi:murein DD-endopeptidase MepM/ murein hydrolase activator NlpD
MATTTLPAVVYPMPGDGNGPANIQAHWGNVRGGSDIFPKTANQSVVSMVAGKVISTTTQQQAPLTGGNSVLIQASNGLQYYYAHLAGTPLVTSGQTVQAGQQIGVAGNTGDAFKGGTGAIHLHIGIGYGIVDGTTATGGTGKNFDAVAYLKSVIQTGNIPALGTEQGQSALLAGELQPGIQPPAPVLTAPSSKSIEDRIKWLAQLLYSAGVDPTKIPTLVSISLAENNSSDPNAVSITSDYGLFQINCPTWLPSLSSLGINSCGDLKDPVKNAQAALYVLNHSSNGFDAWVTHLTGLSDQGLPTVNRVLQGSDYTAGITPGSADSGSTSGGDSNSTSSSCTDGCGRWTLGPALSIPDLGCVAGCTLTQFITSTKDRWNAWLQSESEIWYKLGAIAIGAIVIIIGLLQTNQGQTLVSNIGTAAAMA